MSRTPIDWPRLLIEGAVIVVSILLAFAIDAWWDKRQQSEEAAHQVARVVTELESNIKRLEFQVETLDFTIDMGKRFLGRLGPDPTPVKETELAELVNGIFSSGTIAFGRSATTSFLASGQLTSGDWQEVRRLLSEVVSYQDNSQRRSIELRAQRPAIHQHMARLVPAHNSSLAHPLMADYEKSRFSYDSSDLFSDMYFEGLIGSFAVRMEINRSGHLDLINLHRLALTSINKAKGP